MRTKTRLVLTAVLSVGCLLAGAQLGIDASAGLTVGNYRAVNYPDYGQHVELQTPKWAPAPYAGISLDYEIDRLHLCFGPYATLRREVYKDITVKPHAFSLDLRAAAEVVVFGGMGVYLGASRATALRNRAYFRDFTAASAGVVYRYGAITARAGYRHGLSPYAEAQFTDINGQALPSTELRWREFDFNLSYTVFGGRG